MKKLVLFLFFHISFGIILLLCLDVYLSYNEEMAFDETDRYERVSKTTNTDAESNATTIKEYDEEVAAEIFKLLNKERTDNGLEEVEWDETVTEVAKIRARESVVSYSHTRPNGEKSRTAFNEVGYEIKGARAENIVYFQRSNDMPSKKIAEEIFNSWINSEEHKSNIMEPCFNKAGIAVYYGVSSRAGMGYYAVLELSEEK